jgi:hypothetical protein
MTTIRRPHPTPKPKPAPHRERMTPGQVTAKRLDAAMLSILEGTTFAPTTDINVARAQGIDAALRDMPKYRPVKVAHVVRGDDGAITKMIIEEPMP